MPELKNDRLLRALLRQPVDVTPVWIMRQAGRYLPEYRATRQRAGDFLTLCTTPELACEVTLQPLNRFELDAAILFSDILTIPHAMGLGLHFVEGEGPRFRRPVRSEREVTALNVPDPNTDLHYVMETVRLVRRELNGRVPLIGFAGSPWTLATYMVEGQSSREFARVRALMKQEPAILQRLLATLADAVKRYLNAQIKAGAQAVMIFDSWGGVLAPSEYEKFSLQYMRAIIAELARESDGHRVPVVIFSRNTTASLEALATSGCDALGLDWTVDLGDARKRVGDRVALQGNMDPAVLYAAPERIREAVAAVLSSYGQGAGHVFNLGHGIAPDVNPDHVAVLVEAVHAQSRAYHN
ncbi:MAG: uroporphyrinogen decarboxylase [Acidiferrobacterales bacterium]